MHDLIKSRCMCICCKQSKLLCKAYNPINPIYKNTNFIIIFTSVVMTIRVIRVLE